MNDNEYTPTKVWTWDSEGNREGNRDRFKKKQTVPLLVIAGILFKTKIT
jgi:hypothetical protein